MENDIYTEEDLARMCEFAVILSEFKPNCEYLHDFYSDHVKPLFSAWLLGNGEGVYKCLNENERAYITEFANRAGRELYQKNNAQFDETIQ